MINGRGDRLGFSGLEALRLFRNTGTLHLRLRVENVIANPQHSDKNDGDDKRACDDCPVVKELDLWTFHVDGTFEALRPPGSGSWKENFIGEQVAIWNARTFLGAGSGRFSGATYPDDGHSLFAMGWYTFDLAIVKFIAIGFSCQRWPPTTTD